MLTVLMATHNGAQTLPRVLESYDRLLAPEGGWKLIVVTNACTDASGEILRRHADRLPLLRLEAPERGKNRALNLGLAHVEGDLVVFTDDDAVPEADWLVRLREAADRNPEFDIFGGVIEALWPCEPPDWVFRAVPIGITFAVTPETMVEGPISPGVVWGPNMAVRRSIFEAGHRFDERVGPQPGAYRMGSETEFTTRVAEGGHRAFHVAGARVGHIIRPHQMDRRWMVRRAYRFGRDIYWKEPPSDLPKLLAVPRWMLRNACENLLRWALGALTGNPERAVSAQWELLYFLGYWREAWASRWTPSTRRPA